MIKVEHTKQHQIGNPIKNSYVPVAEGKLVLVEYDYGNTPNKKGEICKFPYGLNIAGQDDMGYPVIKPIIISETEKIKVGDWSLTDHNLLHKVKHVNNSLIGWKKVLALPEHFSPKQLQMIVDSKLKDGDKVLVECESIYHIRGNDSWVKYLTKKETQHCEWKEYNQVKLNQSNHITLHKVEEKINKEELRKEYYRRFRKHVDESVLNSLFEFFYSKMV